MPILILHLPPDHLYCAIIHREPIFAYAIQIMEHAEFEALHLLNLAQIGRLNPHNAMLEQLRHCLARVFVCIK